MGKKIGLFALCFILLGFGIQALVKELPPDQWKQEVENIDNTIKKLSDLRDKELAKAARRQNDGDRLQFQSNNLLDAKRAWADADASREIAARYQQEIDQLEVRKAELLQKHGVEYTPPGTSEQTG
ncbi:hypothetical protein [Simkania sp.]|uniref:hypothetical protein n=1 Tax=Simkania sp. TaxID=34094 RepID=UPI003B522B9C